ncbi:KxYKxGKxW signal peptide domain-containing protein [Levilactobacillus brevis]|uniref:mucin-binding protein n=1 Tax=Levilactobacillus brevis TaxID=1580 RepID=UPI003DA3526F
MRNRLNKMEPEGKTHYKLYKSGRRWVTAGITVFSVGIGLTLSQVGQAKAATNSDTDETENSATVSSSSPTETKNAVVLKSSSAAATSTAAAAVSASTASDSQSTATPAASTSRAVSGAAASDSAATQPTVSSADSQSTENTRWSAASNTTSNAASDQESQQAAGTTDNANSDAASSATTATNTNAMPMTNRITSRAMNVTAAVSEAEAQPTVSLVTTGTVAMSYGDASLADIGLHISSPDETPANNVAYYIQDAAGNYLEDVNGNKVNLLYAFFLDSVDVNGYFDVMYTDVHGHVTKYSEDTDLSTLNQIGSYAVTINAAGKAAMSQVMQRYNAYDTTTNGFVDFVPTFSTGTSDYTFTINIVPTKITATTGVNGLTMLRPSQAYVGSLTMIPLVTVKDSEKKNVLQISNGEIDYAAEDVVGKAGQSILTPADFTYTYQGTETNLTGADTGKYTITLNNAGRAAVQAALGPNYILDDTAIFTTTGAVKAADLGLTIASDTVTYNGQAQGTSVAVTNGTAYDHLDFTTTTGKDVGTYDDLTYALADPTQAAILAKNYNVTTTDGTLVITPADLTVTVKDDHAVYDGRAHGATATVTSGTNYDQLAFTTVAADGSGATAYTKVGTYAMTGTTVADTSNYQISYVNGTLTIDPAKATITIPSQVYWADGTQKNLTAVVTGTVDGETLKYRVTDGMSAVGTKTITATPDADDLVNKNYTISVIPGTLTIGDIAVKYLYEHVDANGETQVDATETGTATHATDATAADYLTYTTVDKPKTGYALAPNTGLAYNGTLTDQGGTVTYLYLAKTETAIVTYFDQTDNKVIKTETLQGAYGTTDAYRTADTIAAYENAGYDLVIDDYPTAGVVYDQDGSIQKYQVTLDHKFVTRTPDNPGTPGEPIDPDNPNGPTYPVGTDFEDLTEQVSRTIQYLYKDGRTAKPDNVQAVNFSRNVTVDEVNGAVVYTDWLTDDGAVTGCFEAVDSPVITGYTADSTSVAGRDTVSGTDLSPDVQVYYQANPEKATVTYEDTTTGVVLTTDWLTGDYQTVSNYRTAERIAQYIKAGYELDVDGYPAAGVVYDQDGIVQAYTVTLKHKFITVTPDNPGVAGDPINPDNPDGPKYPNGTAAKDLSKKVSRTIRYQFENGELAGMDNVQTISFSRNVTIDVVAGTKVYTDWLNDSSLTGSYKAVDSPMIAGYTADILRVAGNTSVLGTDQDNDIVVTYTASSKEATVTYVDTTTGAVLATVSLSGTPDTPSDYRTATTIAAYVKQGYELVSDDYPTSGAPFSEGGVNYTVRLAHATDTTPETKTITQTVHYQASNGTPLHTDTISTITFTRTKVVDHVTGTVVYSGWVTSKDDNTFVSVPAIAISGYHPSVTGTQAVTVTPDSADDVQTIDYVADTVTIKTPDQPLKVKKSQKKQKKVVQVKQLKKIKQPVQMAGATAAALELGKTIRPIKQAAKNKQAVENKQVTTREQATTQKRATLPQTNDNRQASVTAEILGLIVAALLAGLSAMLKRRHEG